MKEPSFWETEFELCAYTERLLDKVIALNSKAKNKVDLDAVKKAIHYAKKYHKHQKRLSGESYHIHPISVANIVVDYSFDTESIIIALLHDTIEDTVVFNSHIKMVFNRNIASLVDQLSRINTSNAIKMKLSREEGVLKVATFSRKVLIVKLADRLDNMRTIGNIPDLQKRKTIANETMEVFVQLAENIGLEAIGQELTELSLRN